MLVWRARSHYSRAAATQARWIIGSSIRTTPWSSEIRNSEQPGCFSSTQARSIAAGREATDSRLGNEPWRYVRWNDTDRTLRPPTGCNHALHPWQQEGGCDTCRTHHRIARLSRVFLGHALRAQPESSTSMTGHFTARPCAHFAIVSANTHSSLRRSFIFARMSPRCRDAISRT